MHQWEDFKLFPLDANRRESKIKDHCYRYDKIFFKNSTSHVPSNVFAFGLLSLFFRELVRYKDRL